MHLHHRLSMAWTEFGVIKLLAQLHDFGSSLAYNVHGLLRIVCLEGLSCSIVVRLLTGLLLWGSRNCFWLWCPGTVWRQPNAYNDWFGIKDCAQPLQACLMNSIRICGTLSSVSR